MILLRNGHIFGGLSPVIWHLFSTTGLVISLYVLVARTEFALSYEIFVTSGLVACVERWLRRALLGDLSQGRLIQVIVFILRVLAMWPLTVILGWIENMSYLPIRYRVFNSGSKLAKEDLQFGNLTKAICTAAEIALEHGLSTVVDRLSPRISLSGLGTKVLIVDPNDEDLSIVVDRTWR